MQDGGSCLVGWRGIARRSGEGGGGRGEGGVGVEGDSEEEW